jgi:hypothetical protein
MKQFNQFKNMSKQEAINYCHRHKQEFVAIFKDSNQGEKDFDSLIIRVEEGDVSPWELPQYNMYFNDD